jgi:hypothetical protein
MSKGFKLPKIISTDCQLAHFAKEATLATYSVTDLRSLQVMYTVQRAA